MHNWLQYIKANNAFARRDYLLIAVSLLWLAAVARHLYMRWEQHPDILAGLLFNLVLYSLYTMLPLICVHEITLFAQCTAIGAKLGHYLAYLGHGGRQPLFTDSYTLPVLVLLWVVTLVRMTAEHNKAKRRQTQAQS